MTSRYPGGGSHFKSVAAYVAVQKSIKNHILKGGVRYTSSNITSKFLNNEVTSLLNIQTEKINNRAITTSAGYVFHKGNYKFYSSVATAFKSPNVDDFAKIFEKKGNLTVPNTNLNPETSLNYEIGSNYMHHYIDFDISCFYTKVFNLMTKLPTEINGESTLYNNGQSLNLVSIQNSGTANIYGAFGVFKFKLSNRFDITSTCTITKANYPNRNQAVGHIPPIYGMNSLNFKVKKIKYSIYSRFNFKKEWDDFNSLADNPDEAVLNFGSPAWATLNGSVFVYLYSNLKMQFAAENILNAHYKTFSSGISSPGRNLITSIYFKF